MKIFIFKINVHMNKRDPQTNFLISLNLFGKGDN